jgi:type IV pilus assembly protein PilM
MAHKVISVAIGNDITKVCEISYKKNSKSKIRVFKSITFPTPENTIEDGYIRQKEGFALQLKSQLKAAKISSKKVIFSMVSSKIANREVIIPLVNETKIKNIIETGSRDYFPIDVKDYILSYIILEKKSSDRKQRLEDKRRKKEEAKLARRQEAEAKKSKREADGKNSEKVKLSSSTKLMFNEEGSKADNKKAAKNHKQKKRKKTNKHIRLAVYAVPANIVKNYYNFASIAGLEVVSIDYSGNSSYQMLRRQANTGTNVFVQLNEQDTVISILKDNVLVLQRTIGYGISALIETVIEQKYYNVSNGAEVMDLLYVRNLLELQVNRRTIMESVDSLDEAAATSELSIMSSNPDASSGEDEARRNIVDSLHFLTNSISRMLDYYKNNNSNVYFESIQLTGIGIRIQGIDRFFSEKIGINSIKIEKLLTVSSKKKAKAYLENPSEFMSCVGSVIKPVNFVPLELIERKERKSNIITSVILILVCIVSSAMLSYSSYQDYLDEKRAYEAANEQYESLPSTEATMIGYTNAEERLEDLRAMEVEMQGDQRISEVLTELQSNLLSNAIVKSIDFSETGVVMQIMMADNDYGANALVAKLLLQFKAIELFDEVQDSNLSVSESGQINLTVSCTYVQ